MLDSISGWIKNLDHIFMIRRYFCWIYDLYINLCIIKLLHCLAYLSINSSRIATIKGKTCETRSYYNKLYRKNDYYDNDFLQMASR